MSASTKPVAVSFINMKGGVGKTTFAFNIAWHVAERANKKVLAIDLDPQANLSQYFMGAAGYRKFLGSQRGSVVDIFEQFRPPTSNAPAPALLNPASVIHTVHTGYSGTSGIDLIPSRLELSWTLKNPTDKSHLLARFLSDHAKAYDVFIIDCAPTESVLTTAAYRASRYIIVPVRPEALSIIGLPLLVRSMGEFKAAWGDQSLDIAGIVINSGSKTSPESHRAVKEVQSLAQANGWPVFQHRIPHSDSFPSGAHRATPIYSTPYARWWVVGQFTKVANEFTAAVGITS